MLKLIDLGRPGLEYVLEGLAIGRGLSRWLLELPLGDGEVYTCLPADVDEAQITRFEAGGIMQAHTPRPMRIPQTNHRLQPVIRTESEAPLLEVALADFISKNVRRLIIFEDPLASATDPFLARYDGPALLCEGDVFYYLLDGDEGSVGKLLKECWSCIGVLSELPEAVGRPDDVRLNKDELQRIAAGTRHILMSAYDGEGMVVWSSRGAGTKLFRQERVGTFLLGPP